MDSNWVDRRCNYFMDEVSGSRQGWPSCSRETNRSETTHQELRFHFLWFHVTQYGNCFLLVEVFPFYLSLVVIYLRSILFITPSLQDNSASYFTDKWGDVFSVTIPKVILYGVEECGYRTVVVFMPLPLCHPVFSGYFLDGIEHPWYPFLIHQCCTQLHGFLCFSFCPCYYLL